MSEDIVELQVTDAGVATVTMNRPDVHNAFDDTLIARLTAPPNARWPSRRSEDSRQWGLPNPAFRQWHRCLAIF